jgi:hypothetical protein
MDIASWRERVLQLTRRHSQKEDLEFCQLVERVDGMNDMVIVQTLMDTFTPTSETGVQQTVYRILGSFNILLYYQAFFESLPRLVSEDAGWDLELAAYPERDPSGREVREIASMARALPPERRNLFLWVLSNDDFRSDHAWAEPLANAIAD